MPIIHPAADLRPGLRAAGEKAAQRALSDAACAADLSSLHLLSLLGADDQARIRSALRQITIAWPVIPDLVGSRDHLRSLSAAGHGAVLAPDGTTIQVPAGRAEQAALSDKAAALETLAASLTTRMPATRRDPAADSITVALETGLPLWCDDIALRQQARYAGVPAFSLIDLVTVLIRQGTVPAAAPIVRRLAACHVTDLPLTADDIIAIAGDTSWDAGPAHAALERPAWWEHQGAGVGGDLAGHRHRRAPHLTWRPLHDHQRGAGRSRQRRHTGPSNPPPSGTGRHHPHRLPRGRAASAGRTTRTARRDHRPGHRPPAAVRPRRARPRTLPPVRPCRPHLPVKWQQCGGLSSIAAGHRCS